MIRADEERGEGLNLPAKRCRLAIVVQRYGEEVAGGAELYARWLAEHLLQIADVEVITTCALDFTTWENVYPAGESMLNGVRLHRFPVDRPRDWKKSQNETGRLLFHEHSWLDELAWIEAQGPFSSALLDFIAQSRHEFDLFIFVTYLYATTYFGLQLVAEKAILVPTAHDEPFLYLPIFRPIFQLPQALVYSTDKEQELVLKVMRNRHQSVHLTIGIGINRPPQPGSAERFRQKYGIPGPFMLYVGRIAEGKNVPELLAHFIRYKQENKGDFKLVLIGKSNLKLPEHPDILTIGFVPEQDKFDAYTAAEFSVMPSLYESLSIIALEAWLTGTPMLVNGRCEVLKQQCRRSNAGLYYTSFAEFCTTINHLHASPRLRGRLGENGRDFVLKNYQWKIIIAKYQALIETLFSSSSRNSKVDYL